MGTSAPRTRSWLTAFSSHERRGSTPRRLWSARFADGLTGEVDVLDRMRGPVFEQARTPDGFGEVKVDPETGAVLQAFVGTFGLLLDTEAADVEESGPSVAHLPGESAHPNVRPAVSAPSMM
jgi:hypothetical protein